MDLRYLTYCMKRKIALDEIGEVIANAMNIRADIVPVIGKEDEELLLTDGAIEEEMPVLPVIKTVRSWANIKESYTTRSGSARDQASRSAIRLISKK